MTATARKTSRRTASRDTRRRQLIDATMKCIARRGMGNTTLADVAREAGLSQGIVNLHFRSKENLLGETLRYLADEYRSKFETALERSGPEASSQLLALMQLDFRPSICDPRKLAVWFAYWGEVRSQPAYRKICDEFDKYYDSVIQQLCATLIEEGNYGDLSAADAANALTSMTNGLWLSCLISPQTWDRHAAMNAVMSYLRGVFPDHYRETA